MSEPTQQEPESQPESQPEPAVAPQHTPQSQTDSLLEQILHMQQEQRAEVSGLRDEISKQRARSDPPRPTPTFSEADLIAARQRELDENEFYCPGCGRVSNRWRECAGRGEAPHPPIEMVETSELKEGDDTSTHTAAPGVLP